MDSAGSGGSPAGDQYIVFKQNTQTWNFEGFDLSKTRVTGGDVFRFLITSATAQSVEIHSATLVTTGVWYHVAAVRGSNFTQIYVNGNLERQTNVAFAQNYGSLPLYFGTSGQSYWDHKLKGALDEVSLYNRALSSNEVAAIYAAGAAGKCKAVNGLTITTQPQSQSVAAGSNAVFTVAAAGAAAAQLPMAIQRRGHPGRHQYQSHAGQCPTSQRGQLHGGGDQLGGFGDQRGGGVDGGGAAGHHDPAAEPERNVAGTTATFSATASGSAPLSYQWQQNGANLSNAGASAERRAPP